MWAHAGVKVSVLGMVLVCGCVADTPADEEAHASRQQELFSTENLPATIYNSGSPEQRFLVGDFNGDGRKDVFQTWRGWASIPICLARFGGWTCSNPAATIYNSGSSEQQFLVGDFNGDDRSDVVQTFRGWNSIPTCLSTGAAWSCGNLPATIYNSGSREQEFLVGDFDGNGWSDVLQTYRGWASIPTCVSSGLGWSCSNYPATIYNAGSAEQRFLVGDFDGDRRADVFQTYRGWGSIPTCVSTGSGWSCANHGAAIYNSGSSEQQFLTGDFDGDGKTDVFQTYRGWSSIPTCVSTGSSWRCSNYPATIYDSGSPQQRFHVADINGDGRSDIVQTYRGWASYPVCFAQPSGWSCANLPATIFDSGSSEQQFLIGDHNGDGATDVYQTYRAWASIPTSISW